MGEFAGRIHGPGRRRPGIAGGAAVLAPGALLAVAAALLLAAWLRFGFVLGPGFGSELGPDPAPDRARTPVAASGLQGASMPDFEPGPAPGAGRDDPCTVRFLTWNIHWGLGADGVHDASRIAAALRAADADVVLLNEVDVHRRRSGNVHQPSFLAAAAGYPYWYYGSSFTSWASGGLRLSHYGNLLLSRFPIVHAETVALPRPRGREPRSLLLAEVVIGGVPATVAGVHLGLGREERLAQAAVIHARTLGGGALSGRPVILMGDFNAHPASPEMALLTGDGGFVDTHAATGAGPTFPLPEPWARIDYILVSPDLAGRVMAAGPLPLPGSDHLPVAADIAWPAAWAEPGPLATASCSR